MPQASALPPSARVGLRATLLASYLVGSSDKRRCNWGFWILLPSNLLWHGWGHQAHAYALMVVQGDRPR
ncbi:MAG: hypothetical protein ABI919_00230 [Ramlibacter sp.]